ncbi:MAG: glycosyltransferase [Bacteroidia bacterium]|nr:glycosyltransferase [Bacteroidia bacterium]
MKILQLLPRFPWPLKDGGAICFHNFAQAFIDAGNELTMAVLNTNKHHINFTDIPEHLREQAQIYLIDINTDVNKKDAFLNLFTTQSYNVQRFVSMEYEALVVDLCKKNKYDIIIFESIFVAPYLSAIRSVSTAKCVLRAHNVEFKIWETLANDTSSLPLKAYLHLLVKRLKRYEIKACNAFDVVFPITETDQNILQEHNVTTPMCIIPFGINVATMPSYLSPQRLTFFHLGSMDWQPNQLAVQWFIDNVWVYIAPQYPQATFVIAGRNMPSHFLKYNNKHNIKVVGEITNAFDFMQSHAVQVVPIFAGSGIRVKIIEAMALGKCIIATSLGAQGINYTIDKNICIANDATEFLKEIVLLIDEEQRIETIGKAAITLANEQHNIKVLAQQLLNFSVN